MVRYREQPNGAIRIHCSSDEEREFGMKDSLGRGSVTIDSNRTAAALDYILERAPLLARLVNEVRSRFAVAFKQKVAPVTEGQVRQAARELFRDPALAINIACLIQLCIAIRAEEDFPELIIDDHLGALMAETIAGTEPNRLFARTTFHVIDAVVKKEIDAIIEDEYVAEDDLLAGLAAGFETVLPGWEWQERRAKLMAEANREMS
jgi:hypothetical protein